MNGDEVLVEIHADCTVSELNDAVNKALDLGSDRTAVLTTQAAKVLEPPGDGFCLDYSAVSPKGGRGGVWAWPSATRAIRSFAEMIDRPGCRRGRGGSGAGPSAARAIRSFSEMIY